MKARLDADPGLWAQHRDDVQAFALSRAFEILRAPCDESRAVEGMSGRDAERWEPLLSLAALCEQAGVDGLVHRVRAFADQLIEHDAEDRTPVPEETLIARLAESLACGQIDLTPQDLLALARQRDAGTFSRWTPHRVDKVLGRSRIRTEKTRNGRRSYRSVTREQLRRVARTYGFDFSVENASTATNATVGGDDNGDDGTRE